MVAADIHIHVLKCKNDAEATDIMKYVEISARYAKDYAQPIPWKDFKCKHNKTVFIATHPETQEVIGWAICYLHSYRVCKYIYLSSISTMRGDDGKAKYRNVGTLLMNKIIDALQQVDFIML
jgi:hypothetical protein